MTITLDRVDFLAIVNMAQYATWENSSDEKRDAAIVLRLIDAMLAADSSPSLLAALSETVQEMKELTA